MEEKRKVGNVTAGIMVTIAIIIDGIQFLLTLTVVGSVVASVLTFVAGFGFWLWFSILGVKYLGNAGGKKALIGFASLVAEAVPFVNALPATTAGVLGILMTERAEEKKRAHSVSVKPRSTAVLARAERMRASRAVRTDSLRKSRVEDEQDRHPV